MKSRHTYSALGVTFVTLACGSTMVTRSQQVAQADAESQKSWALLDVGRHVLVDPRDTSCQVRTASSLEAVINNRTAPLAKAATVKRAVDVEISRVEVNATPAAPWIALELKPNAAGLQWLKIAGTTSDSRESFPCLSKVPKNFGQLDATRGQQFVFAPWARSCDKIVAVGSSVDGLLLDSDPGRVFTVSAIVSGASGGEAYSHDPGGQSLWVQLNQGVLSVSEASFAACFIPAAGPAGAVASDAASLLHVDDDRCTRESLGNQTHIACRSTLGAWEGQADNSRLDLHLVHRTFGPVHFMGSRLVDGSAFGKTVVAISLGKPSSADLGRLYERLDRTIVDSAAKESGSEIRIVRSASDPAVTYRVQVDVEDVRIGAVKETLKNVTAKYEAGERMVHNTEYDQAEQAVSDAEMALEKAQQSFEQARIQYELAKQAAKVAFDQCVARAKNDTVKALCSVANVAAQFFNASESEVVKAREQLTSARAKLADTPTEVAKPIMKPWKHKKTVYSCSTSATLTISIQGTDDQQPKALHLPLSKDWSDYQVEADPEHGVAGHDAERGPIEKPAILLEFIADQASEVLGVQLKRELGQALIEQARRAFQAAGNESKPGFEEVDSIAYDTSGRRVREVVARGRTEVSNPEQKSDLPNLAAVLGPHDCLLAVAVAEKEAGLKLSMNKGQFADNRHKRSALLEICHEDFRAGESMSPIRLQAQSATLVRWGIYRTSKRAQGEKP